MTPAKVKELESLLEKSGYKKYNCYLSGLEDYGYFKSFDITYTDDGDKRVGYQVEYRFWNWEKCGEKREEDKFGVDIIVINSRSCHRSDLVMTTENLFDIANTEKVADGFNSFCKEYLVGQFEKD